MIFRVKRGPVLLWTINTAVQRTNERAADITGANPVAIADYYQVAVFEVKCTNNLNLALTDIRIYGALSAANAFPPGATAPIFCRPVAGSIPVLTTNTGVTVLGSLPGNGAVASAANLIVPGNLILEYSTGAPGATPNFTAEIRALFLGSPFYGVDP